MNHYSQVSLFFTKMMMTFSIFSREEGDGEPAPKRQKTDDNLDGGMEDLAKAKVTEVSTTCLIWGDA